MSRMVRMRRLIQRYESNQPAESSVDRNGDGAVDVRAVYDRGVIAQEETFDRNARAVRRIRVRGGIPVSGEFDADGDGVIFTARTSIRPVKSSLQSRSTQARAIDDGRGGSRSRRTRSAAPAADSGSTGALDDGPKSVAGPCQRQWRKRIVCR
jgi:hypothetical protein